VIYLDNNATTKVDQRVVDSMMPFYSEDYGNPSSVHKYGMIANNAVINARRKIASLLGSGEEHIYFTSGATESNNTVIKGVFASSVANGNKTPHFIVSSLEHKCVLNAAKFIKSLGAEITFLKVDQYGRINPTEVEQAIRQNTVLVSIMWVNNEVGSINPIKEIAEICNKRAVLFHTDAAQAISKLPLTIDNVDFLSGSAHKFYGPKGVGFMYVGERAKHKITPLLHGGGQESGLRSGTLNVAGIVGMAEAVRLYCAPEYVAQEADRQRSLITRLHNGLKDICSDVVLNGPPIGEDRACSNLNITIKGINEKIFNKNIKQLMISSGSACSSADLKPSYVLTALGVEDYDAFKSYRFGVSKDTSEEDIDSALVVLKAAYQRARSE